MKTKTLAIIASGMIFGAALLTGIAVVAILLLSNSNNPVASPVIQESGQQSINAQSADADFVYLFDKNFYFLAYQL